MKKTAKPTVSGYRIGKKIGRGGMSVVYSATAKNSTIDSCSESTGAS